MDNKIFSPYHTLLLLQGLDATGRHLADSTPIFPKKTSQGALPLEVESGDLVVVWTNRPRLDIQVDGLTETEVCYCDLESAVRYFKTDAAALKEQSVGERTVQLLEKNDLDICAVKEVLCRFDLYAFAHSVPHALDPQEAFRFLLLKACLEGAHAICIKRPGQIDGLAQTLIKLQKFSIAEDLELPAIVILDPCGNIGLAGLAGHVLEEKPNGMLEEVVIDW